MLFRSNLYFNPKQSPDEMRFNGKTFDDWKKTGKDTHSRIADPRFVDAAARDFRLRPDSPAPELGFRPFNTAVAGPRDAAPAAD